VRGAASISAVVLAVVFGWAAVAKLARLDATRRAFAELGLPAAAALGVAVPVVELAVAASLIVRPAVGAAFALALLAAFTLVVIRAVSSGSPSGCACFGARRVEPVGPSDVVRNGLLAALAALATGTTRLISPSAAALAGMVMVLIAAAGIQAIARRRTAPSPRTGPSRIQG
jgi:hypothetical protein